MGDQGYAMATKREQIRGFFAVQSDPYAGGDLANAQRLGSLFWGLLLVLAAGLLALSPPDEAIGGAGWAIAGAVLVANLAVVVALRRQRFTSWGALLSLSYAGIAGIALLQWLAGGVGAPYERLLLLPILFAAALHPARRLVPLVGAALVALVLPFLYDGWNAQAAGSAAAGFVIWTALAAMGALLMSGIRRQRVVHAHDEAEARSEARQDPLTKLPNRRAFDEALDHEVARARRLKFPLSVAMVDIENFKVINDRWGHAEGDRCLREVAEAIRESLRSPDLSFRWGGDEFAVILSGASAHDTPALGERITGAIAARCERPDDEPITARFASAELLSGQDAEELVERAGLALTEAKTRTAR